MSKSVNHNESIIIQQYLYLQYFFKSVMSFLSNTGPVDKLSTMMGFVFPLLFFLTFGLKLSFMEPIMEFAMTFGGLLSTFEPIFPYDPSQITIFGATWALAVFAPNLVAVMGGTESKEIREYRQFISFMNWLGWTLSSTKYIFIDGNMAGSFNYVWMASFVFLLYAHLSWVLTSDLGKKMKIL